MKSAILLAGLYAKGETTVVEPAPTRDHTELMLEAAGVSITRREKSVTVQPAERLELGEIEVPGDFSSAAPFIVAATLVPGSELHIHGVNLNPRRTGLLTILERMGARVTVYNRRRIGGRARPATSRCARPSSSRRRCSADEVPLAIDELPLFALAASCAHGNSRLRGAEELRAKESDRVEATVDALARARPARRRDRGRLPDPRRARRVPAAAASRAAATTGSRCSARSPRSTRRTGVEIEDAECVAVSFPGFFELLDTRSAGRPPA